MDKVLIVDDSDFDRRMIRKAIAAKSPGVSFTELPNGLSVVETIATERPRLAILDIRMPGRDGFDILSEIRADKTLRDLPVLMISGSEQPEDRAMAKTHGADGYFVKPVSADAYFSLGRNIYDQYLSAAD